MPKPTPKTFAKPYALIVDDEVDLCTLMKMTLAKMDIDSKTAHTLAEAQACLAACHFDFCLTDLNLPDGSGLQLVDHISQNYSATPVAVITAYGSMDLAIDALKLGAFDFVNKPLELPRLRQLIQNALKAHEQASLEASVSQACQDDGTQALIGESDVIGRLRKTIRKLARSQAPVFVHGESGTGKEVVAKLIHELGPRSDGSFVPVNCGAIPSELMESEFFGHKKGSFTGAISDKLGLFQQADGGTLFLDEVADLPLAMQVKLLRAIQEKKVRPIGSSQEIPVDIRLLSATHKNLAELVADGVFRQDLYYRINVIELKLPSLNERDDDILLLAEHFIEQISTDWQDDNPPKLSEAAKQALKNHHFLGNVRELRNVLERALTLCDGDDILPEHLQLPKSVVQNPMHSIGGAQANADLWADANPYQGQEPETKDHDMVTSTYLEPTQVAQQAAQTAAQETVRHTQHNQNAKNTQRLPASKVAPSEYTAEQIAMVGLDSLPDDGLEGYLIAEEKRLMLEALKATKWNRTKAAKLLGMSFRSFRYRLKKLELDDD